MIKAILFDLDGVLQEDFSDDRVFYYISKNYGVEYSKVKEVFERYD